MRVLLAGATGVIGGEAVPVLAAAGHQVTGLAAAASTRSRAQLDWKPAYGSWRSGLTADLGLRAPGESQNQAAGSQ
jgi:nucleoside-diphosphate-sugar epimerase